MGAAKPAKPARAKGALGAVAALFGGREAEEPVAETTDAALEAARLADYHLSALARRFEGDPEVVACEFVWGAGRVGPSDDEDERRRLADLNLRPGSALGLSGSGLGALAAKASRQGFIVAAFEWRAVLAKTLRARHAQAPGRPALFDIHEVDARAPMFGDGVFDAVIDDGRLVEVEALSNALCAVRRSLKPGGTAVLVEPVVEAGAEDARLRLGFANDAAALKTLPEWTQAFKAADLELDRAVEVTGAAIARLRAARRRVLGVYDDLLAAAGEIPHARDALARIGLELASSQNRLESLERGDLAVYRFVAAKPRRGL